MVPVLLVLVAAVLAASTYNNVVIAMVDALRFDQLAPAVLSGGTSPFRLSFYNISTSMIQSDKHMRFYDMYCGNPTVTTPRLRSLVSGRPSSYLESLQNFNTPQFHGPNFVDTLRDAGFSTGFAGDNTWTSLLPSSWDVSYPFRSFDILDTTSVDEGIMANIHHLHALPQPRLIVIHTLGLDHMEHQTGVADDKVMPVMEATDVLLRELVDPLDGETLLLVMGDHGMTDSGCHGGSSHQETHAGLMVYSTLGLSQPYVPGESVAQVSVRSFIEGAVLGDDTGLLPPGEEEGDPMYTLFAAGVCVIAGLLCITVLPLLAAPSWEIVAHVTQGIGMLSNCLSENSHVAAALFALPHLANVAPVVLVPLLFIGQRTLAPVEEFGRLTLPMDEGRPTPDPTLTVQAKVIAACFMGTPLWFVPPVLALLPSTPGHIAMYILSALAIPMDITAIHTLRLHQASSPVQVLSALVPAVSPSPIVADVAFFLWGAHYSLSEVDPSPAWLGLKTFSMPVATLLLGIALFGPHAVSAVKQPRTLAVRAGRASMAAFAALLLQHSLMGWSVFAPRMLFETGILLACLAALALDMCRRLASRGLFRLVS
ncbi:Type I phosphodiesterase/nucleotide pyrophosphatase/phosphate transferase [Carpediemonas membranifera]|uniref:Type I phosphodiesterase/nucleotide pyrophosphatase/phosphate transferase n=1 Tax=Carpediemonas membranifera TaxID=201153 RepID=A0A8J6AYS5_9EUKA|nr:Type I phosphodiesterase/nucleotide pyrophosphatase/phosphate transferase [Carpediemonas membranifera]|eukprot:KAG9391743.1 Type I phosphodiesterase/nucleotide pyrophosphatase/phosphate transferase [Carpediemonas membranifera]